MTDPAIAAFFAAWHRATTTGDLPALLRLIDEDAVFLLAGHPPMRKEAFATGFGAGLQRQRIDYAWITHDVRISGDLASCWNELAVTVTPLQGGAAKRLAGNVLTVLRRKGDGSWVLIRDANLLTLDGGTAQ